MFVASMSGMLYMLICLALNIDIVYKLRAQHILDRQAVQQDEVKLLNKTFDVLLSRTMLTNVYSFFQF